MENTSKQPFTVNIQNLVGQVTYIVLCDDPSHSKRAYCQNENYSQEILAALVAAWQSISSPEKVSEKVQPEDNAQ